MNMRHVFITHSNITSIVIYDTIKQLLERGDSVIVITKRNQAWNKIGDERVINCSNVIINSYKSIRFPYFYYTLCQWKRRIKKEGDFILYLPTSFDEFCFSLQKSSRCKQYYYIEEGSLSYTDPCYHFNPGKRNSVYRLLLSALGFCQNSFWIDNRFAGTMALSKRAFAWNKNKIKIVNNSRDYFDKMCRSQPCFDNLFVFGYLSDTIETYHSVLKYVFSKKGLISGSIAVKFHPRSDIIEADKKNIVVKYIQDLWPEVQFLNNNFVAEKAIQNGVTITCIQNISSLVLYNALESNTSHIVRIENGEFSIFTVRNIDDYIQYDKRITV